MLMSTQGAFNNNYEDYTADVAKNILNGNLDGISDTFKAKLEEYKTCKLNLLKTNKEKYIFSNASVYSGKAGLAFYHFNHGLKNETKIDSLKKALKYIDLNNLNGHRISFLCGDAGPLAMAAVISYKLSSRRPIDLPDYKVLVERLLALDLSDSPNEILYGKAGYLYALLLVNSYSVKGIVPASHIEKIVNSILKSGKHFAVQVNSKSPLLWQWHDKIYLGAAHGMAGILYMLLQARAYMNNFELRENVKQAIDWLIHQRYASGNFPSSLNTSSGDRLVQWCHGAPGFVALCTLAAQVYGDDTYLKIAHVACELIWKRGICTKGYSMCHGVSGNAYAFIQMYQATKEPIHLYRACCFMEWCAVERPHTELHSPDRPGSLFEGLLGPIYLADELQQNILLAKFPGYTV